LNCVLSSSCPDREREYKRFVWWRVYYYCNNAWYEICKMRMSLNYIYINILGHIFHLMRLLTYPHF